MSAVFAGVLLFVGIAWVSLFLGELTAWRRGLPGLTDGPELPPLSEGRPALRWRKAFAVALLLVLSPVVLLCVILVVPPLLSATWVIRAREGARR
jgi:hypothetical protein